MNRSSLSRRPRNKVKTKSFPLKGGLNLVDAPMNIREGMLLAGLNYEALPREGYRLVQGFERYDGQASPSIASYWVIDYDGGTIAFAEDDVVTGGTSGATGKVLSLVAGSTTASGSLVLTNVVSGTGPFEDNEDLEVSAAKNADSASAATERGAATPALDSTYQQDAIETQRDLIDVVGTGICAGNVLGVHVYENDTYAFRNKSDNTECYMFKQSSSGWSQVSLGNRIPFLDAGAGVAYVEGETITGTTSGASATINRVVLQSGAWGTDAAGYFVIGSVTSGPFQAEATTGSVSGAVPITSAEVANTLQPGGRFEFENYNFYGTSGTFRMYGVDGVSPAFEWDGTVFVPILTGNTNDTPSHLAINEYHLMLTFEKGSLQNSGTGNPYDWGGIVGGGAAEIGTGDELVGLKKEVGGALAVFCRNRTFALFGKNVSGNEWDLRTVSDESGAIEWSIQRLAVTRYLDDRGFTRMDAVQEYGDFGASVYSQLIEPLVLEHKSDVVSSIIVKDKSQLRTFFSDGTGICATFNGKELSGFTILNYINNAGNSAPVLCTANGENASGDEIIFFGSSDGYVYQMDKGTSFDGSAIDASMFIAYSSLGNDSYDKQIKKVVIEADGSTGIVLNYNVLLDYSSGRSPTGINNTETLAAGGSLWDNAVWNAFSWAAEDVTRIEGYADGVGRNVALQLSSSSTYIEPYTLYGITYHYLYRKLVR